MAEKGKGRERTTGAAAETLTFPEFESSDAAQLVEHIKDIERRARSRRTDKPKNDKPPPRKSSPERRAPVVQLPIWPDPHRAIPNPFARSALFTVGNPRRKRAHFEQKEIATFGDIKITYTGEELRQDDEDVFLQLLHISRISPLGDEIEFTAHQMLKALGWPTNKPAYERLRRTINRLSATGVTVSDPDDRYGYNGSLIRSFAWQEPDGRSSRSWRVWLEPRIVALFGDTLYTRVIWEHRRQLKSAIAKWLLNLYSSHASPYPMKVATIHRYSGSTSTQMSGFRRDLKRALDELVGVGFLKEFEIDGADLVHVTRVPRLQNH